MEFAHKFTICRLCLCERESFIDIFQVNEWFVYVPADVIADLLQVQVSETDGHPHVVCSTCLGKLTDFKKFKEQCQNSRDTYSNVIASFKSHAEHPAHIEPSASIKIEQEEGTNDVDATTEVELRPVNLEPEDPLDTLEAQQEVRKRSISLTSLEYLAGHQKRTRCESYGPCANIKVGEVDVKVKRDCISPGERIDMVPDEESDLNRVEWSVIESRRGTIKREEEANRVDASVDATLGGEGTVKLKIESENETTGGSERERGEEALVGVEKTEVHRERFSCRDCGKGFRERDVLIRHLELHGYVVNEESCIEERDSQVRTNVICGAKHKTSDSLEKGLQRKLSDKVRRDERVRKYVCDSCGKGFIWISHLKRHLLVHSREKPFVCAICGTSFSDKATLRRHKLIHTGEKPYLCGVCDKRFAHKCNLRNHERIHTGKKSYEVRRDERVRKYVCDSCGKGFIWISHLKRHLLVHSREKPFVCAVCGKSFSDKPTLRRHKLVHTGEKPYPCGVCGKHFAHKCDLRNHERIHTGEKPYECEMCGKKFSVSASLAHHRRLHSGEKPYLCEVCGIHFANRNNLKSHRRLHTGEKPYKCEICGKRFSHNGSLTQHKRVHSGEKPFSCKVCNKCFSARSSVNKHLRLHSQ